MALPATCVHEVQVSGSDTLNGGHFDPSNANMATDLAATSATGNSPVVTSASYNFVAGDVGAWLFVKAGTNWTPGWYQIASVAANAATLSAAIGAALSTSYVANTVAGCATTASPTGGTWSIDYSQGTAAIALTGLTTAAANAIILTASATVAMVGNGIFVTGGTNFTTGVYNITSASAGVSLTVDRNCTTDAGVSGTAGVGGCYATPGFCAAQLIGGNVIWHKTGTYTLTGTTQNVSGGPVLLSVGGGADSTKPMRWEGYGTLRGDLGTAPTVLVPASSVTTISIFKVTAAPAYLWLSNIVLDGALKSAIKGLEIAGGSRNTIYKVKSTNCTNSGMTSSSNETVFQYCEATGCSTQIAIICTGNAFFYGCNVHDNTIGGISINGATSIQKCLIINNTGASADGLLAGAGITSLQIANNTVYGNGRHGINLSNTFNPPPMLLQCNLITNNGGFGITANAVLTGVHLIANALKSNTSGNIDSTNLKTILGNITLTADPFTNAGSGDFSLNNMAGGGASCRAAGTPGVFPGGLTTGYLDIGAVQHADPASSGLMVPTEIFGIEGVFVGA